jgi:hypothetical protein
MDIVSIIIGFAIGVITVGLAIELGTRKTTRSQPNSRHTKSWNIAEVSNPRIMAEYLGDVDLPKDSKLIVNKYKNKEIFSGLDVRKHSGIKGNFIIGDDRVLILSGPIKKDEIGFWTVEKEIIEKLNNDFEQLWLQGTKITDE